MSSRFAVCCLLMVSSLAAMALDDVVMLPTRNRIAADKDRKDGNTTVEESSIVYNVAVTGKSFKPLENITIRYNIFYEDSELGSTAKPEVKFIKGSYQFDVLENNRPMEFATNPIKLQKASLDGNWYFTSGASNKSRDRVVGLWFKAFDSTGKQIGEYANPASVARKQVWKD